MRSHRTTLLIATATHFYNNWNPVALSHIVSPFLILTNFYTQDSIAKVKF